MTTRRSALVAGLAMTSAAVLAACGPGGDDEYVLHYTTYTSASSDQGITAQRWAEEVEELTDGGVTVRFHFSQTLLDADESVQGTLDGRADLAQVGSLYAASDLSMFTAVELPFEVDNPEVQMTATQRLYQENDTYREDFDRQGVRPLFPLPVGNVLVGTQQQVTDVDDLRGTSIRGGGLMSQVMIAAGANPVAMTANDVYESMQRGVVDGYTSLALSNLATFGLPEATPFVLDPGVGAYGSSIVVINEELFDQMPSEYQDALLEASTQGIQFGLEELDKAGADSCELLRERGTEFSSLPQEQTDQLRDEATVADGWVARYEERGYDAQSVLDDYRRFVDEESDRSDYVAPLAQCIEEAR